MLHLGHPATDIGLRDQLLGRTPQAETESLRSNGPWRRLHNGVQGGRSIDDLPVVERSGDGDDLGHPEPRQRRKLGGRDDLDDGRVMKVRKLDVSHRHSLADTSEAHRDVLGNAGQRPAEIGRTGSRRSSRQRSMRRSACAVRPSRSIRHALGHEATWVLEFESRDPSRDRSGS